MAPDFTTFCTTNTSFALRGCYPELFGIPVSRMLAQRVQRIDAAYADAYCSGSLDLIEATLETLRTNRTVTWARDLMSTPFVREGAKRASILTPFWLEHLRSLARSATLPGIRPTRFETPDVSTRGVLREHLVQLRLQLIEDLGILKSLGILTDLPPSCTTLTEVLHQAESVPLDPLAMVVEQIRTIAEHGGDASSLGPLCNQVWHMSQVMDFRGPDYQNDLYTSAVETCTAAGALVSFSFEDLATESRSVLLQAVARARLTRLGVEYLCRDAVHAAGRDTPSHVPDGVKALSSACERVLRGGAPDTPELREELTRASAGALAASFAASAVVLPKSEYVRLGLHRSGDSEVQ